jgi:4-amino-4-deoxy-L-arabinose transferase-like glycosyltransferase
MSPVKKPEFVLPLALFLGLFIHGALLGLTDDEAYYWALAQHLDWAYAYHPPMVAWLIALSQHLFGWLLGTHSSAIVRLPSAALAAGVLALALRWLALAGVPREKLTGAGLLLVSLAGIFALSWMMVPDLPLLLGWMLMFVGAWGVLNADSKPRARDLASLGFGAALALLSKYSAVLAAGSAGLSLLFWARSSRARYWGCAVVIAGACAASVPIVIWNSHHEWASILYQIRDRHEGGSLSFTRYLRFWLIELFAAGPMLLLFAAVSGPRAWREGRQGLSVFSYCWLWAFPAVLVFCSQPLWADFKPHWALIGWWPLMLALAWAYGQGEWKRVARAQRAYGLTLGAFVIFACHVPVGNWALAALRGPGFDPKLDVTNDLVGWDRLESYLRQLPGNGDLSMPVVGSRYQTAGQADFALGPDAHVTMLPREVKDRDEWASLDVSRGEGPDWPALTRPVLFVADIRYDAPPVFPGARCSLLPRLEARRAGYVVKWIEVWRCEP